MREHHIVISGATDGIGKATARRLGAIDHQAKTHIWIIGRCAAKTALVVKELAAACPKAKVGSFIADLSLQAQVAGLAQTIAATLSHIDVLINNVGGFFPTKQVTAEGFELTFAVNHLSSFLLTNRLLSLLKKAPSARIITVSSAAHRGGSLDFDNLQGERTYHGYRSYHFSKLGNVLFTRELARRLVGTTVTANCLHPGLVSSKLSSAFPGWLQVLNSTSAPLGPLDVDQGADTSVYLATAAEVAHVSGRYFAKCREAAISPAGLDQALAERLWLKSEELLRPYLAPRQFLSLVRNLRA